MLLEWWCTRWNGWNGGMSKGCFWNGGVQGGMVGMVVYKVEWLEWWNE